MPMAVSVTQRHLSSNMKAKCIIILTAMFCCANAIFAEQSIVPFAYTSDAPNFNWGTSKVEIYDLAIKLDRSDLYGYKIVGIQVPVSHSELVEDYSVWISNKLETVTIDGQKVNNPNITSQNADCSEGMINVMFENPYVIEPRAVYIGYSFKVRQLDEYSSEPLPLVKGSCAEGLYVHTTRTYRSWKDCGDWGYILPVRVLIEGEFKQNALAVRGLTETRVLRGENGEISLDVSNLGYYPISSVGYSYQIYASDDSHKLLDENSSVFALDNHIDPLYDYSKELSLPLITDLDLGIYDIEVTINDVNGRPNEALEKNANSELALLDFMPVHRQLFEEWTGSWCQYCVRGVAGIDELKSTFDDFICISYHGNDAMEMVAGYPHMTEVYPFAYIDRTNGYDPFFGESTAHYGMTDIWMKNYGKFCPVEITAEPKWLDLDKMQLEVTSEVTWVIPPTGNYAIEYVLLADDLHQENWYQQNAYSGSYGIDDELLQPYVNSDKKIYDFHFNDVAVLSSGGMGINGFSAEDVDCNVPIIGKHIFDLSQAIGIYGDNLIQDKSKLKVVAFIIEENDSFGTVINSVMKPVEIDTGIVDNVCNDNVYPVSYFDVNGMPTDGNHKGLLIRLMSDGSVQKTFQR